MKSDSRTWSKFATVFVAFICVFSLSGSDRLEAEEATLSDNKKEQLDVLFIGNSYTARHNLAELVTKMAVAGNPNLTMKASTVIYGGRTLADHWRLGTQNIVRRHELTKSEQKATVATLTAAVEKDAQDRYAKSALTRHKKLLSEWNGPQPAWDVVVLQSYRDDLEGPSSRYAQFAPKFAALAKAQGARVILYETTPTTQNAEPLRSAPERAPVLEKARQIAALADRIGANVAPMSLVALKCQTERPDLALRFINDAHLNQTMAYLTACTLYAALFERSPEGLPVDSVTDIRYFKDDRKSEKDRDGKPITRTFSERDRSDLQAIAWAGYQQFQDLRER